MKFKILALISLFTISIFAQNNLPNSKEATFVEVYSPTEVTVRAKGIAKDVENAENDAKKSAVYFILYNYQDKILQSDAEIEAFKGIENEFFKIENINEFISFMGNDILSRVKTSSGVKIEKLIRINTGKLTKYLQDQGILVSKSKLQEVAGNPFIMVIPEVKKGENPIDKLQQDPLVKKGAEVIEAFLTTNKYEVQVPEQMDVINDYVQSQSDLKNVEDDISYKLALSIGADVYITYNVNIDYNNLGKQAAVAARAYETTTGRLLGTETGYSPRRPGVIDAAVVEEAMTDAAGKVLQRISAYWKDDISNGKQFKVVLKISAALDEDAKEDLDDDIIKVIKEAGSKYKALASGDNTKDFIIWSKKFNDGNELYTFLRNKFKEVNNVKPSKINVNRKLVIIELKNK
jgi:hypothetical protein